MKWRLTKTNLLEDGFEFRVPSKRRVYGVLVVTLVAVIVYVILSMLSDDYPVLHWASCIVSVPCWGVVWLLLATPNRSHTRKYYIRYRLAQVLAMSAYFSALMIWVKTVGEGISPFDDLWNWAGMTILAWMVGPAIFANLGCIPIILKDSKTVRALDIESDVGHNPIRSVRDKYQIVVLLCVVWIAVTILGLFFGAIYGLFHDIL